MGSEFYLGGGVQPPRQGEPWVTGYLTSHPDLPTGQAFFKLVCYQKTIARCQWFANPKDYENQL